MPQKAWLRESIVLIGLMAVITLIGLPLLMTGPQSGHSFFFNLSWTKGFAETFAEGIFYPRWLPHLHQEAGSPVFFFYAPFPFYLSTLGHVFCPDCTIDQHMGFGMWFMMLLAGVAFYTFARQLVGHLTALSSAFLYTILPYHFYFDLLQRQALGETSVYIFMPLALLSVKRLSDGWHWVAGVALAFAMALFSHLPGTLLFSPFLLLYAVVIAYRTPHWRSILVRFAIGIILGMALSGIYLIPALTLQEHINSQVWWDQEYNAFMKWFVMGSVDAKNPQFLQEMKDLLCGVTIMAGLLFLTAGKNQRAQTPWLIFLVGSWFLMTPLSFWLWKWVPVLQKVQFPFRAAIIFDLAIALIAMQALGEISREFPNRSAVAMGIFVVLCLGSIHLIHHEYEHHQRLVSDSYYQERKNRAIALGWDGLEYFPAAVKDYPMAEQYSPVMVRIDKKGSYSVEEWRSRRIILHMTLQETSKVIIHQFYFPGWQAQMVESMQIVPLQANPEGLLELNAPAGHYSLQLTLETLPAERVGAIMSFVALICMLLFYALGVTHGVSAGGGSSKPGGQ
ncbi:MAG: hypothetical protein H7839_03495 [Magnetococcus sp. YQC-5]